MSNKVYDVFITDIAWEQMIEHTHFLKNISLDAANRFVGDFQATTDSLKQMPERCPWFIHDMVPFQKYRKILFGRYHMALFQIQGKVVYINTVVDCRKEYAFLL